MTKLQTYWNGEPTQCERVMIRVGYVQNPTWWCAGMESQERPAVVVHYGDNKFVLDNIDGQGWHKVTSGKGSWTYGHKQLPEQSKILGPDTATQCRCGEEDEEYEP